MDHLRDRTFGLPLLCRLFLLFLQFLPISPVARLPQPLFEQLGLDLGSGSLARHSATCRPAFTPPLLRRLGVMAQRTLASLVQNGVTSAHWVVLHHLNVTDLI